MTTNRSTEQTALDAESVAREEEFIALLADVRGEDLPALLAKMQAAVAQIPA